MLSTRIHCMQTSKRSSKKVFLIGACTVALLFVGVLAYWWYISQQSPTASYSAKYPVQDVSTDEEDSEGDVNDKASQSTSSNQTSEDVSLSSQGSIAIVDLAQESGFVNALATVSGFSVLKCVYQFESSNARPIVRETAETCSGVSIPQVEFEKIGTYTLTVTAYSESEKITTSREIEIR